MDKDDRDKQRDDKRANEADAGGSGGPPARGSGTAAEQANAAKAPRAGDSPAKPADTGAATEATEVAEKPGAARAKRQHDPRLSRSLEYGVAMLEAFSGSRQTLGIADIADIVGISRSTTHRYAMTLVALGHLEQDDKRKYRLAQHAADSGSAAIRTVRGELAARAVLEELRERTGHTVSMGVLNGPRVIYIHRLLAHGPGQHAADGGLGVGATIPAHCSALGKVLLASLSDAWRRELLAGIEPRRLAANAIEDRDELAAQLDRLSPRGVVICDEEPTADARSIAALVPRARGKHPAAIDVTVPSSAYTVDRLRRRIGPHIKRAAKAIAGE